MDERYQYIMVDEYQDTNVIQDKFLKLITKHYRNIAVVGDDNQSIYRFRGAHIENILEVKPLTTKVTSFPCPFRGRDCLSEIQRCPQYPAAYAASTAARLIRSDKVQVLLFRHRGTFAPMSCCTVTGTDFKISRMKYREPIL